MPLLTNLSFGFGIEWGGEKAFYLEFAMNAEGFSRLLDMLKIHGKDLSQVAVVMESTGCYHINLFAFLCSEDISGVDVLAPSFRASLHIIRCLLFGMY